MDIKPHTANDVVGRTPQQQRAQAATNSKFRKHKKLQWIVAAIVLVVLIAGGVWWYFAYNTTQIDSSKYQAVFLENNQVYFGKLYSYNTNHPYLKNVWYIQTPDSTNSADSTKNTQSSMQLIQLTKSVHGPEDEMLLNKSKILFVENLSSNSQVTKLINSNK